MLRDTPYTQGIQYLAGWNSADDCKKARQASTSGPEEPAIKVKIYIPGEKKRDTDKEFYQVQSWVKHSEMYYNDWDWNEDEGILEIFVGDSKETYTRQELVDCGAIY